HSRARGRQGTQTQKLQESPATAPPPHYLGSTRACLFDPSDRALRVRDVNDDSPVLAAVELDRHCLAAASDVPELPPASPIEDTGGDDARDVRPRHAPALPPAFGRLRVSSHPSDFREGGPDVLPQSPELAPTTNLEDQVAPLDRQLDHRSCSFPPITLEARSNGNAARLHGCARLGEAACLVDF